MSVLLQSPPGPDRYTFMPAAAVSASPSDPQGVVAPGSGPGESTSGNVGSPFKRNVRVLLKEVSAPCAAPASAATTTEAAVAATSPRLKRLVTIERCITPFLREQAIRERTTSPPALRDAYCFPAA